MDDSRFDNNDLVRQLDTINRSRRTLTAEFERQRTRLSQLVRTFERQKTIRDFELRRQLDYVGKETRRKIFFRSRKSVEERERVEHLLCDDSNKSFMIIKSTPNFKLKENSDDKKRKTYGCLLPHLKAPLNHTNQMSVQVKRDNASDEIDKKKKLSDRQKTISERLLRVYTDQHTRMEIILSKCANDLAQSNGDGYDHFLHRIHSNRNTRILTQHHMK